MGLWARRLGRERPPSPPSSTNIRMHKKYLNLIQVICDAYVCILIDVGRERDPISTQPMNPDTHYPAITGSGRTSNGCHKWSGSSRGIMLV